MKTPALDKRIALGLFVFGFAVMLATEKPAGFVRDESVYFHAAERHARWVQQLLKDPAQAFTDQAITQAYDFNHEHPALMKNLYGLSFLVFHEGLGLLRPAAAFRVPAFAFAALILSLTYLLARRRLGHGPAVLAALTFFLIPRQFFEAHLSCFDVPIATMWLLTVYCFVRALDEPRWWLATGLAFGLALGTKHNAFFIPVVLIPCALWVGARRAAATPRAWPLFLGINGVFIVGASLYALMVAALGGEATLARFTLLSPASALFLIMVALGGALTRKLSTVDLPTFRAIAPLVAMAALGPVIFYLHWPYLWHHPVDRTAWYFGFHLRHEHYAWFYLGQLLRGPPFPLEYVVVKTALTVPTSLFVPMLVGLVWETVRIVQRKATWFDALLLANAAASMLVISLPNVPHFGGVKHWFPSMPFLAIFGANAVWLAAEDTAKALATRFKALTAERLFIAFAALCIAPTLIAGVRIYPYGTSHYSELAGGLPGAAQLGMQRQFWANNVTGVLEWINQNARPGERVYLHENHGGQINDYRRNGMLRTDLGVAYSPNDADIVAYQYHQEFRQHEYDTWQAFGTTKPVTGLYLDETPQIIVYRRGH